VRNRGPAERALLAGFATVSGREDTLDELALLAETAGARVVGRILQRKSAVHPGRFLSRGKLEDAGRLAADHKADLLISDEDLSPAQVRNLEEELELRVIDRSELILDIFAQRARTREAQLQVELAQLRYLLPRLTGMWGHLSRTGGGIGTRGPGETQLEVDRRRVREKISVLEQRLERVEVERRTQSQRRQESFRASLVGYTNAGKSTLFNRLTHSSVPAENRLFATLDTTTRKVVLPGDVEILLSDTVGFIRKLPHHLIASFRATLREVENSDLLIHVVDAAHPNRREQIAAVGEVLEQLLSHPVPQLLVLNKVDLLSDDTQEIEARMSEPEGILISALRKEDTERLLDRLRLATRDQRVLVRVECPASRRRDLLAVTRRGEKRSEAYLDGRLWSEWWLDPRDAARLRRAGFRVETPPEGIADRTERQAPPP
jgi:GTP-binding protein HflX